MNTNVTRSTSSGIRPGIHETVAPLRETDALRLLDELHARAGVRLIFAGMPELGATGGAAFVRWPDGRDAVLSRCAESEAQLRRTAEILAHLRACGVPAPRYDLIAELSECTVLIQERLPGDPTPPHIDPPMMRAMLTMVDGFAGLLADFSDVPLLDLTLEDSQTTSLERYDDRSRRLLAWIEQVRARGVRMSGTDLIHRDYHRDNILFRGQTITGIVDWHDARRVDAAFGSIERGPEHGNARQTVPPSRSTASSTCGQRE